MATPLDAQARIKLTIGSQFVDMEILKDQVAALVEERDQYAARVTELEKQLPNGSDKVSTS